MALALAEVFETVYNTLGASKTSAPFDAADGSKLYVAAKAGGGEVTFTTLPTNSGTALTWAQIANVGTSSSTARLTVWESNTIVGARTGMTVTVTRGGSNFAWGMQGILATGHDGTGDVQANTTATTSAPSRALTTQAAGSAVLYFQNDFNAVDGAARTYRTMNGITPTAGGALEFGYFRDASIGAYYAAYWNDAGAIGAKTVGISAPSGQTISQAAIEIKAAAGTVAVGRDLETPWTIRAAVGRDGVLPWTIRTLAARALVAPWTIRTVAARDLATPWTIRGLAGKDLAVPWVVRALAGRDLAALWTIRALAAKDLVTPWTIRTAAGRDLAAPWLIRALAGRDLQLDWTIQALGVVTVGRDLALPWTIRTLAGRDVVLAWTVRAAVGRDVVLPWWVLVPAGRDLSLPWVIRAGVGRDVALLWTVRGLAGRDVILAWQIGAGVVLAPVPAGRHRPPTPGRAVTARPGRVVRARPGVASKNGVVP